MSRWLRVPMVVILEKMAATGSQRASIESYKSASVQQRTHRAWQDRRTRITQAPELCEHERSSFDRMGGEQTFAAHDLTDRSRGLACYTILQNIYIYRGYRGRENSR